MSYGEKLPDQVDRILKLSDAQLDLLSDVRDIFKERAALEKEYSTKLSLLAKKAAEKKSKRITSVVVGDDPSKAWDEAIIRNSSIDYAYADLVAFIESEAQSHSSYSDSLLSQVADAAKTVERKFEETKKKQSLFYQKILGDRDKVFNDRQKAKQKYDEECTEIETYRQKQNRAADDRHAARAAKQLEQQQNDVGISKNTYLISIAVANKYQSKFYEEDIPILEDQLQIVQKSLLNQMSSLVQSAQALQASHLTAIQAQILSVQKAFEQIDVAKDQVVFIEHNIRPFNTPLTWNFEPSPGYYDNGEISVEPAPKVFLQNKLSHCRAKLEEITPMIEAKQREADQLKKLITAYETNRSLGDSDEVATNLVDTQHQLTLLTSSACILNAEVDTIAAALGGDEGEQRPHQFKAASFTVPANCEHCKTSIWGLSKQGKTCKLCGISVHTRCELKVPANCQSASTQRRTSTLGSTKSQVSVPSPNSPAPSYSKISPATEESRLSARVVYDFTPTSPFELGVFEGTNVLIVEEDDGSGWVKVQDEKGGTGLIPASYVQIKGEREIVASTPSSLAGRKTSIANDRTHARSLYDYDAQGPDEISMKEGELIALTEGPSGGMNYGDGWWEGYDRTGKRGIFPSNYVEVLQ